ncbi:class I SAM-dependent methyltransferase [Lactococcus lactis]|nr:class I SAM-dependent methyltransferase [Lactococcus lactis]
MKSFLNMSKSQSKQLFLNLGYLPKTDKSVVTRADTSLDCSRCFD